MSDVAPRPRFQFRLRTVFCLTVCLAVFLAFVRGAADTSLGTAAMAVGILYAIMIGVTLLGGSTRFA